MQNKKIHVMLCFDDNFWAPAFAVMRGICLSTHRRKDLVFHLCEFGLSDDHRADLEKITTEFGAQLVFQDLRKNEDFQKSCASLPTDNRLNQIMYARLLVEVIIPKDVERVIYLDCDTYVRRPIEELAEIDLEGMPIAAVEDYFHIFITGQKDIKSNRDLFDPADAYFNSGLLVIDTKKWAESQVLENLERMVNNGTMARIYYDQDFLNLTFKDRWKKLDQLWNILDPRPAHQALNPKMLHYTGTRRPWNLVSGVAFARVYRHVMTNELFYRFMRHRMKRRINKILRLK